jgi:hypothetical protein
VTDPDPQPALPPGSGAPARASLALVDDGALTLRVHPSVAGAAEGWIPLDARPAPPGAARIRLVPGRARPFAPPAGEPGLEVLGVDGWVDEAAARVRLAARDGALWGSVDLARLRAAVALRPGPLSETAGTELMATLSVCAALLLGRLGRALLHAAAVVAPDGRAWLLVGDSRTGKTSTCVNLIRAGWDWLADDQVVVRPDGGGVVVEGWPRRLMLDEGFTEGRSRGRRAPTDPALFGPGRLRRAAPLAGVLLPRVRTQEATALRPAHPADALAELIRQSPWLLADAHAAPGVLALLSGMSRTPVFHLTVGTDTYSDPALLQVRVAEAVRSALTASQG